MSESRCVLVTGGSGFIGANLVRRLLQDGHTVHLLVRPTWSDWRLRDVTPRLTVHVVDIADALRVGRTMLAVRPEWVFHLAAYGGYAFQDDVQEIARTNNLGTASIVTACVDARVDVLVNAGSSSEYGEKDHAPGEYEPTAPNSHYAVTKAAATELCRQAARAYSIPMPTLRLYSAYGPFEDPRRLMPTLVAHALAKQWPPLVAPETSHDFVHVDDVVDAFLAIAAEPPRDVSAIYNVGTGQGTTMRALVDVAAEVFGVEAAPAWNSMPRRPWDTNTWVANPARIKAEYRWSPRVNLRAGLKALADWFHRNPEHLAYYRANRPAA
jgi:UDP-glucose 4-epimerase